MVPPQKCPIDFFCNEHTNGTVSISASVPPTIRGQRSKAVTDAERRAFLSLYLFSLSRSSLTHVRNFRMGMGSHNCHLFHLFHFQVNLRIAFFEIPKIKIFKTKFTYFITLIKYTN